MAMEDRETLDGRADEPDDPARRGLLLGLLTAYTAARIPWAWSQPVASVERGAFTALSALLVGRQALDAAQATRLYDALAAVRPRFPTEVRALLALVNQRRIDPAQLQSVLDAGHPELAPVPRTIVSAWALGVVGSGDTLRCVAYETALDALIVADVLKPPTYAYGAYASWAARPAPA
jgi:hypothetical protein